MWAVLLNAYSLVWDLMGHEGDSKQVSKWIHEITGMLTLENSR